MRMALEVRSLSKNYGKVQALKNVSFKIGTEQVYYKVDKSLIESGQTLEPIEFFRFDPTEFSYFYSY